uniref:Uncharacterized protein n=1 Tax=Oryza brachyantha TaxID=4533 RepID=J3LTU9_ORYBR
LIYQNQDKYPPNLSKNNQKLLNQVENMGYGMSDASASVQSSAFIGLIHKELQAENKTFQASKHQFFRI